MKKLVFILVVLSLAGVIFFPVISGRTLMTSDDNIGLIAGYKAMMPAGLFSEVWTESPLVGMSDQGAPLNWSNLWLLLLSPHGFTNSFHMLSLIAGSLMLGFFLFRKNLPLTAVLFAVITAFWVGSNFTLIYAGHIRKFSILFLFCSILFSLDILFEKKRWEWSVLAGLLLGIMFLEQQDVAFFFGLFAGAYAFFLWVRSGDKLCGILRLLPVLITASLIAAGALVSSYKQNVAGVSAVKEDVQGKWEFCTQWSWPPEESIDFIAPGYTGWRSGEPDGPYWGRMGRSVGWEQTRQGFMNFKLENTYIGFIPLTFAFFALFSCRYSPHRAAIRFWGGATLVALLLAFGKYFPLYNFFWHLPVVNNIRNPNKFLQVSQIGLAILTAYGVAGLLEGFRGRPEIRNFFWITTGIFVFLTIWALGISMNQTDIAAGFVQQGWPAQMTRVIASNQMKAIWWAVSMSAITAAVFSCFSFKCFEKIHFKPAFLPAGLVLVVAIDAFLLSKHYVKTLPQGYIEENAVTQLLNRQRDVQRVATVTQDGFYNIWLTYLFPYNRIPAFNFTQMPRMPQDYKQFLESVGRNPLRMWQLSGVGFLLGPTGLEKQLPSGQYKTMLRYDVLAGNSGGFTIRPNEKGSQSVFQSLVPAPRYALIGGCEKMNDKETLTRLSSSAWKPFGRVILPENSSLSDPGGHGFCGTVEVLQYRSGRVLLKVHADTPGFLRAADKYDPNWKAFIDGSPAEILRADFIFQAVYVPAGMHEVELKYSPENKLIGLQFAGMAAAVVAAVGLVIPRRKKRA